MLPVRFSSSPAGRYHRPYPAGQLRCPWIWTSSGLRRHGIRPVTRTVLNGTRGFAVFIFDEVHGHGDHAGNPEEDDVEAGNHHAGWVELTQRVGVFRPAQRREGPQCEENTVSRTSSS